MPSGEDRFSSYLETVPIDMFEGSCLVSQPKANDIVITRLHGAKLSDSRSGSIECTMY